jgi:uncharacterized protein YndB with AHSA1/START domain
MRRGNPSASQSAEEVIMAHLIRKATVHAPVDKVYHYVEDKTHLPQFWPSLVEVSDIKTLPNGGKHYTWSRNLAGFRLQGRAEDIEHVPNRKLVERHEKGIDSTMTWLFEEHGRDTEVTLEIDYSVPKQLKGKLKDDVVLKFSENEADAMLGNLRAQLEL